MALESPCKKKDDRSCFKESSRFEGGLKFVEKIMYDAEGNASWVNSFYGQKA